VGVSGTDQKWKYAGEMLDSATGLYYIGARYMDPELGHWLSLDLQLGKLSMPQTMNRHVYCANNPDPLATSELTDKGIRHLRDRALHIRRNVRHEDRPPLEMDPTS
jgi:RHS repeat-associated protein